MGNRLWDEIRSAGLATFDVDFTGGSKLDKITGDAGTVVTALPTWKRTRKAQTGIYFPNTSGIYYADSTARKMITGFNTWVIEGDFTQVANARFLDKAPGYQILVTAAGVYLYVNAVYSYIATDITQKHQLVITLTAGQKPWMYADGTSVGQMDTAVTPVTGANALVVGSNAGYANACQSILSRVSMAAKVLTGPEASRLYEDFLASRPSADCCRKNFYFPYQGKKDWEYAAKGIFFDFDETFYRDAGVTKIKDLTGNYPGTVGGGVPQPLPEGGIKYDGVNDWANHGNMTQLNGNTTLSFNGVIETPSGTVAASSWWLYNNAGGGVYFVMGNGSAGAAVTPLTVLLGAGSIATTAAVLRAGCKQHLGFTFNNGVGKLYVDGESYPITVTTPLPATFPNFSATPMRVGTVFKHTSYQAQGRTQLMSDADMRDVYLKDHAQKLVWQAPGEDCPVSLVTSYDNTKPNALGGGWQIISGTWKNSEDSQGRRWAECVTTGTIANKQPNAFGTMRFAYWRPSVPGGNLIVMYNSVPDTYIAAGAVGYAHVIPANGQYQLIRYSGSGAIGTWLIVGAVGQLTNNAIIEFLSNRRTTDCRFTVYTRLYGTSWALAGASGGGSNPTGADSVYTTCAWLTVTASPGDKILTDDPTVPGRRGHPQIFQGVLDPTAGEVP